MNISLNTARYFIDIVDERSFTKAAEKNFVAQTSLSHAVAKLERELNTQLLIRSPGNVTVTETGAVFLSACRDILAVYQDMSDKINFLETKKKEVQIGFIDIYECIDFKRLQEEIKLKFPGFSFKWVDRYSVGSDEDLDIVIGYTYEKKPRFQNHQRIFQIEGNRISLLVSRDNALSGKSHVSLQDLNGQTLLLLLRNRYIQEDAFRKFLYQKYFKETDCRIRFVYSAMERRTLAECNKGVAIFERDLFKHDASSCKILDIDDAYPVSYVAAFKEEPMESAVKLIEDFFSP